MSTKLLGLKFEEVQERFAIGGTLQDFFNGFDALLEHIRTSFGKQATPVSPSFLCKELLEGTLLLHYFRPHHVVGFAMLGMIKAAEKKIYQLDVAMEQVANEKLCSDRTQAIVAVLPSSSKNVTILTPGRTFPRESPKSLQTSESASVPSAGPSLSN
ncbi:guanylate cyclase soluble subunit alpha-1 [Prionailurus iriomotensis]